MVTYTERQKNLLHCRDFQSLIIAGCVFKIAVKKSPCLQMVSAPVSHADMYKNACKGQEHTCRYRHDAYYTIRIEAHLFSS